MTLMARTIMIKGSDGYEYETLHDCFIGRKAGTRYNILLRYFEGAGEATSDRHQIRQDFQGHYDRYLAAGHTPASASDAAYLAVVYPESAPYEPQSPGSPDRAGQPGAGPAPTDLIHPADQPPV